MTNMLDKCQVANQFYEEQVGMINVYACGKCGVTRIYLYRDSGVTPLAIVCECGEDMFSQFSKVHQPTVLWYRPDTIEELNLLADQAYTQGFANGVYNGEVKEDVIAIILENYIIHYNSGGCSLLRCLGI